MQIHPTTRLFAPLIITIFSMLHAATASAVVCPANIDSNDCVANDLQPTGTEIINGPTACTAGETFSATVRVLFEDGGGANARYSVGFFVGENGESAIGGASCAFDSLQPIGPPYDLTGGSGGFRELNGDACGDITKSDPTYKDIQLDQILCEDKDGDGNVDISYVLTWENNGNQANCTDPLDPLEFRPNPPKCLSDLEYDLPIDVEQPPSIDVGKGAAPNQLREPGGDVAFPITIINTSPSASDPVEIFAIVDAPYGDISNQTDCTLPFILAPSQNKTCTYTRTITGVAGDTFPDTVTVSGRDDEGNGVTASDSALVTIIDGGSPPLPGDLRIVKFASPARLPEPGGTVQYDVLVANLSTTGVELTSLMDDIYGDLNGKGSCAVPQTLVGVNTIYFCAFQEQVNGEPGDIITDVITARGTDHLAQRTPLEAHDDASVEIYDLGSDIEILKLATPSAVTEPGGQVIFTLQIQNHSVVDTVTINSLFDSQLGVPKGDCAVPIVLAPAGDTYQCSYPGLVSGNAGDIVTNIVEASGRDDDGHLVFDTAAASVDVIGALPSIEVSKIAVPPFALAAGSNVRFVVAIQNTSSSADPVTITSLDDDIYGSLASKGTCSIPASGLVLQPAPGPDSFYICSFVESVSGISGDQEIDTVTATGVDDESTPVIASDQAVVTIVDVALPDADLRLAKIASPIEIPEPGGDITYYVILANASDPGNSNLDLTVNSMNDDLYGSLDGKGTCALPITIPVSEYRTCHFTESVTGSVGDTITDIIVANATTVHNLPATAQDDATVTIIDIPGSIAISKTARPSTVIEPGQDVTFQIVITNTSEADSVTINSLLDNIHGDLNGQGTCLLPQTLFPGRDPYRCDFTAFVGGDPGDQEINTVVAAGEDDDGNALEARAQANVAILDRPPTITAIKVANPPSVLASGGMVTFSFTTTNTSEADTLTLDTLVDSAFGDLNGRGSCSVPQTLSPMASYTCQFQADISGIVGETHLDLIEVTGVSDDGDPVSAKAVAIVNFIAAMRDIPAMGQLGLAALALLIALLGMQAVRRRK